MHLTRFTEQALKTLAYLAQKSEGLASITQIAYECGMPFNHASKIVHRLGVAGLVRTVRGRTGGARLARTPDRIAIGEVVRAMEPALTVVECFDEARNQCMLAPGCSLKLLLRRATRAYLEQLDQTALTQLLPMACSLAPETHSQPNHR